MAEDKKTEDAGSPLRPSELQTESDAPPFVSGRLDALTVHINEYLRYYRMVPWVLGAVFMAVILRRSRVHVRRFRQVADLPDELVRENRRLSGVTVATGWNTVGVWHVPSWRWVFRWGIRPPSKYVNNSQLS